MESLHRLECELEPVEWLAQCIWQQAGKDGCFDFDEVYTIVGPLDQVVFGLDQPVNLHSKLDELLSCMLDINKTVDGLLSLPRNMPRDNIYHGLRITLVRIFSFLFAKTCAHGLDLLAT
jgi:hypothetical protein